MVQVLPAVPNFGSSLAQVLSGVGSDIGEGLKKRNAFKGLQALENQSTNQIPAEASSVNASGNPAQMQGNQSPANLSPMQNIMRYNLATKAFGKEGADAYLKSVMANQDFAQKQQLQERKFQEQRSQKLESAQLERAQKSALEIDKKRDALKNQRRDTKLGLEAVQRGDVGGLDINYVANLFGEAGQPFKNYSAQQLETAMKNLTIDDLQKVTGQKNQWLDKMVKSATAGIGKSQESNEMILKTKLATLDVQEKELDVHDELLSFYEKQGVTPPSNLNKQVSDIVKPYAQMIEDRLSYDTRVLYEKSKGERFLNNLKPVSPGTPLTIQKRNALLKKFNGDKSKALNVAKRLNYSIPKSYVFNQNIEEQNVGQE
jgi:hypothetical protein